MTELALAMALACAMATNVAMLCKHRGANAAPLVTMRSPLRSAAALFRSRWWTIGFLIAAGAWGLHVAAMALAPLSLVQAVIAGGLVLLVLPAQRWFGLTLGRREWLGIGLSATGLCFLAITAASASGGAGSAYSTPAIIAFEAAALGGGAALLLKPGTGRSTHAAELALMAGFLVGVSDVSIKAVTGGMDAGAIGLLSPWTLAAALAGAGAFFALARGLQVGDAIQVIMLSSVAANVAAILGGVLVFGDPIGSGALDVVARVAAFAMVIAAVALIPSPTGRAEPRAA